MTLLFVSNIIAYIMESQNLLYVVCLETFKSAENASVDSNCVCDCNGTTTSWLSALSLLLPLDDPSSLVENTHCAYWDIQTYSMSGCIPFLCVCLEFLWLREVHFSVVLFLGCLFLCLLLFLLNPPAK